MRYLPELRLARLRCPRWALPAVLCICLQAGARAQSIVGEWRLLYDCGLSKGDIVDTYREDGTFETVGWTNIIGTVFSIRVQGTWELEGAQLILRITQSNNLDFFPLGERFFYSVIEISANRLTYTDGVCTFSEVPLASAIDIEPDSDGDGLGDIFEGIFFDSPTAGDPAADDDGDGRDNLAEYLAGTNPLDGSSFFQAGIRRTQDGAKITVSDPQPGRRYRLQYSADLREFETVAEAFSNSPRARLELADPRASGFYRVEVVNDSLGGE